MSRSTSARQKGRGAPSSAAAGASADTVVSPAAALTSSHAKSEDSGGNKRRLLQQIDSLHQEMEVAQYGLDVTGHNFTKKMSKKQRSAKLRKRRSLERQDLLEQQSQMPAAPGAKRLRGSRASFEDHVIQGSLVILPKEPDRNPLAAQADDGPIAQRPQPIKHQQFTSENENRQFTDFDDEGDDDDSSHDAGEEDATESDAMMGTGDGASRTKGKRQSVAQQNASTARSNSSTTTATAHLARKPRRKGPFRMRNFKSIKLAEQHGEALDAHTRGRHREAIRILKQIAREAPSAPQVYSSLGMVYCDMLREAREGIDNENDDQDIDRGLDPSRQPDSDDATQAELLDLARKAYGAYHIAAVLCKKDFALWVRAADLACEVADLHSALAIGANGLLQDHHRSERLRWLNEARNDYHTADSLKPPGIDIPAKLATVSIELGQLSEALTLLTDLKNRHSGRVETNFESSYKAWWLYADLMLVIGRECDRWNQGDESNSNYMFRRWLRKHSRSFDWKLRRLQALVKALEAAIGSQACRTLLDWLRNKARVSTQATATEEHTDNIDTVVTNEPDVTMGKETMLTREKRLFEAKSKDELIAFDKTSREMVLELGEEPQKQRQMARERLVRSQKMALDGLMSEFQRVEPSPSLEDLPPLTAGIEDGASAAALPICASLNTATDIAAELIRLALDMEEYECGVLVGNSLSSYMRQRAALIGRVKHRYEQEMGSRHIFVTETAGAYHSDSEESLGCFSDDEDLEARPDMQEVMEKGVLPAVVSVLLGCCLAGQRGMNFLAFKRMESLIRLPHDTFSQSMSMTDQDGWTPLSSAERGRLDRTEGFALVGRTLRRLGKTKVFAPWLAPLFNDQIDFLVENGALDDSMRVKEGHGTDTKTSLIMEVVSTSAMFLVEYASAIIDKDNYSEAKKYLSVALTRLGKLIESTWFVRDGYKSLSPKLRELLDQMQIAARLSVKVIVDDDDVDKLLEPIQSVVAVLSGVSRQFCKEPWSAELPSFANGLIPSAWLSPTERRLAKLAFNLCVSTNVSCFSGWEVEEFNFTLIRRRPGPKHFGISIIEGVVFGTLTTEIEDELIAAWDLLSAEFPSLQSSFVSEKIAKAREEEAYLDSRRTHEEVFRGRLVPQNGESEALQLLLHFSKLCLLRARGKNIDLQRRMILLALSIVLPATQFCVREQLWDAGIGRLDEPNAMPRPLKLEVLELAQSIERIDQPALSKQQGYVRRNRKEQMLKETTDVPEHGQDALDSALLDTPCSLLLDKWNECTSQWKYSGMDRIERMARLNVCLHSLRSCSSEAAAEKASLDVAAALIGVAAQAQNPFLCLEQAARFASKAPKRGTSDLAFQERLPDERQSTPLDALVILGRADCLGAVFFCEEAAYLCNFVAKLFHIHHVETAENQKQWNLVGAKAYNVWLAIQLTSAKIRRTKEKMSDYHALKEALPIWREAALAVQKHKSVVDSPSEHADMTVGLLKADPRPSTEVEPNIPRDESLNVVEV